MLNEKHFIDKIWYSVPLDWEKEALFLDLEKIILEDYQDILIPSLKYIVFIPCIIKYFIITDTLAQHFYSIYVLCKISL